MRKEIKIKVFYDKDGCFLSDLIIESIVIYIK